MTTDKGTLIRWIENKGFGFIKPDKGGRDLFIHISALKTMSRKPVVGDVIFYRIQVDESGKIRAVDAKIEGVAEALTLEPINRKRKTANASRTTRRPYRNAGDRATQSPGRSSSLLAPLIAMAIIVFVATKIYNNAQLVSPLKKSARVKVPTTVTPRFECRGKIWCSEMTSYEEAVFYLRNCPGTKMDGDHDGVPCEQQFGRSW